MLLYGFCKKKYQQMIVNIRYLWKKKKFSRKSYCNIAMFSTLFISKDEKKELEEFRKRYRIEAEGLNGFDRITLLWKNSDDSLSPEFELLKELCFTSFFMGFILGGANKGRETYWDFINKNKATAFTSMREAHRLLTDQVILSFFKGGIKLGCKVSLVVSLFACVLTLSTAYKNRISLVDYFCAGSIAGFVHRYKQGPKGMIAGAALGATLFGFSGIIIKILFWINNSAEHDLYFYKMLQKEKEKK